MDENNRENQNLTTGVEDSRPSKQPVSRRPRYEIPNWLVVGAVCVLVLALTSIVFSGRSLFGSDDEQEDGQTALSGETTASPSPPPSGEAPASPAPPGSQAAPPEPETDRVLFKSEMGDILIPVMEEVEPSSYKAEHFFVDDSGMITYDDGSTEALVGIDVSEHQGEIDWRKAARDGVDFAMIRLGYRGYTVGTLCTDGYFEENLEGALKAGIEVGVYFFSQALNAEEAVEEAQYVIGMLDGRKLDWPVAYDWEPILSKDARTNDISPAMISECANAFCATVEAAGYTPSIYFSQTYGYLKYDLAEIDDYDFWLAQYSEYPSFYYDFEMWQYTDSGSVDGISGNVDLNLSFRDYGD